MPSREPVGAEEEKGAFATRVIAIVVTQNLRASE